MKLITVLLLTTLTACAGQVPAPKAQPEAQPEAQPKAQSSLTPAETDCGVFDLKQGENLPEAAMRCFIDAAAQGRPARLQETRLTIEGDPIISWYRVKPAGGIEVTRDTTKDKFGSHGIVTESCTGPVTDRGMLSFAGCAP